MKHYYKTTARYSTSSFMRLKMQEALSRRVEIRRQKWLVKSRELELIASRNFLLPELFPAFGLPTELTEASA